MQYELDWQLLEWQTYVNHLGTYLNSALDISVDSKIKYSQFIGQFNCLNENLVLCNQIFLVIYLSHIVVHFMFLKMEI